MLTINTSASGTSETDGRNEKAKKAGSGETSRTSGRASRKGVCKMFILRSLFAYPSLNVR